MAKFNNSFMNSLGIGEGLLNSKSLELKEGLEIINIPIDKIIENEKNNYSLDDIDELIDSIKTVGLKQNLDVMRLPDGKYKLLTGHRRFTALKELAKEDDKFKIVPCSITDINDVKLPVSADSKEKYLIHITNSTQRNMTESDRYNQYQDLVKIYTEAKNNGYVLSDKIRNLIANDMNISPAQVGKMDYIRNNASEELKERLNNNEVTVSQAEEIAHHDKAQQATLKPKKERTIDLLTENEYYLPKDFFTKEFNDIVKLIKKCEASKNKAYSRKDYAKIIDAKKSIEQSLTKAEKLINK